MTEPHLEGYTAVEVLLDGLLQQRGVALILHHQSDDQGDRLCRAVDLSAQALLAASCHLGAHHHRKNAAGREEMHEKKLSVALFVLTESYLPLSSIER